MISVSTDPILAQASQEFSKHEYHRQIQAIFAFLVALGCLLAVAGLVSGVVGLLAFIHETQQPSITLEGFGLVVATGGLGGVLMYTGAFISCLFCKLMSPEARKLSLLVLFSAILSLVAAGAGYCAYKAESFWSAAPFLAAIGLVVAACEWYVALAPRERFTSLVR